MTFDFLIVCSCEWLLRLFPLYNVLCIVGQQCALPANSTIRWIWYANSHLTVQLFVVSSPFTQCEWPLFLKPAQNKVCGVVFAALRLSNTRRCSRSTMEWSSTEGTRQIPEETYSRLHHGVIFPLSSCQIKLLFPRPKSQVCVTTRLCVTTRRQGAEERRPRRGQTVTSAHHHHHYL